MPVNITCSVSGVVISISGGFWDWWFLSAWEVSPCLTPTVMCRALPYSSILRSMSLFRARSGVMYRHLKPDLLPFVRKMVSKIGSIAASVFPMPVGATRRMFPPFSILGMTSACGGVGSVMPLLARACTSSGLSSGKGMGKGVKVPGRGPGG